MIYYPISALFTAIASTVVFLVAIIKNPRSSLNRSFGYFSFSIASWSYGYFFWQISHNASDALFWCRALMMGAIFIPPAFFHFSLNFIDQYKRYKQAIIVSYFASLVFALFNLTSFFVRDVRPRMGFDFWPTAGIAFAPFLAMFFGLTLYVHILMYKQSTKLSGFERNRIKYVFLGTAIGFLGGTTNYPLWYDIPIPPVGNILVAVYVFMVGYATVSSRFMDIAIFAIRGLTLVFVYCLVLGIPFLIGFQFLGKGPWVVPVSIMGVLATAGPFIYNYIRHRAENAILKEQRRYQQSLLETSKGMTLIKELDKLLSLIVHVVSRTIRIKDVALFLLDKETNIYSLKAVRYKNNLPKDLFFNTDDIFIKYIRGHKVSIVREEIRSRLQRDGSRNLAELRAVLAKLDELKFSVIIPSFVGDLLLGFLVLGEKLKGQMYTQDDLNVFGVLANQAALAIENAVFYQEQGKTLAEKFHEHKVWSIGRMGSGVGHQINNRFQVLIGAAERALSMDIEDLKNVLPDGAGQEEIKRLSGAIEEVIAEAKRGSEIAVTLTHFSRKNTADMKPIAIDDVFKGALNLLSCKFRIEELYLEQDLSEEKPMIHGNLGLAQDIFMNLIDNAHDAETIKKQKIEQGELLVKEPYVPHTIIKARPDIANREWSISVQDNGIGMKPEELSQLFIPFFTTKATTEKGTGLGMYIIKQMVEALGGTIKIESRYGEGTAITVSLKIA